MKITLTKIMGVDFEKPIQIDMHKNMGKISENSNPGVFEKLSSVLVRNERLSYNIVHCYGYVHGRDEDIVKISLCKGTIKKITSLHLEYECLIVGQHIENYDKLNAKSLTMKTYYNSMNCKFYEKILTELGKVYEINKKSEAVVSYKDNILSINVRTLQEPANFSKLVELVTYMYEIIFLTEGFFPKRIDMSAIFFNENSEVNEENCRLFYRFSRCYQGHKSQNTEIGAQLFKRDTILKEWILFRKKTELLFDYYLYSTNNLQFIDVDLFHLITVLEGYSKYTEVINNLRPMGRRGYVKLYDRLKALNKTTPECQIIFASQIEENTDYLIKLVDHRNDFSHQFQYKRPFDEEQMREFFHKINLLLRVLFFREVGVDVQDRQIRAIIRKYFNSTRFVPTYDRVLRDDSMVFNIKLNDVECMQQEEIPVGYYDNRMR